MASIEVKERDRAEAAEGKPAVEARQGVISGRVVTVLLVSLALAVLALGVTWFIFGR
jgi:hypothetical protein